MAADALLALNERSFTTNPAWKHQGTNTIPTNEIYQSDPAPFPSIDGAPTAAILIQPRGMFPVDGTTSASLSPSLGQRQAELRVETLDPTATYTVTIAGTAIAYDATTGPGGSSTTAEVIQGIADAIEADATVGGAAIEPLVRAHVISEDGVPVRCWIRGQPRTTGGLPVKYDDPLLAWALEWEATGSAVVAARADAQTCTIGTVFGAAGGIASSAVNGKPGGPTRIPWTHEGAELDIKGIFETANCGPASNLFVEVLNIAGVAGDGGTVTPEVHVWIGPSSLVGSL